MLGRMTDKQVEEITRALNELSFGNGNGGGALEGLTIAMCGGDPRNSTSVSGSIEQLASAAERIAEAIEKLAEAVGKR